MGLRDQQAGAVITRIEAGSPARAAGLRVGDVVTALGGRPIRDAADLRNRSGLLHVGETVELTVLRGGEVATLRVALTAPVRAVVEGGRLTPLLDGATFGPSRPDAPVAGVEIVAIKRGGAAWGYGLREGDIVTSVNREEVGDLETFSARTKASPRALMLNLIRDGAAFFVVLR